MKTEAIALPQIEPKLEPLSWDLIPFALSIRQPWAWLILNAGKDVENRTWSTNFRGWVAIHASKGIKPIEYNLCRSFLQMRGLRVELPKLDEFQLGGIVGIVRITGCTHLSASPWFMGPKCFELEDPLRVPFVPMRGALGLWRHGLT